MTRLNNSLLAELSQIPQPKYKREQAKASIVHLGIGAFHRAHQAYYTEQVMNQWGGDWSIIGCSLRSGTVQKQLHPQDGLYTVLVRGEESQPQIIGAVQKVLLAPEDPQAVIDVIADEQTKIVSLTITEKGYCHNPATGELNLEHPDILHDLSNLEAPKTAIGFIVAAMAQRQQHGLLGLSIMSCDNLPDNGRVTKNAVLALAHHVSPNLSQWISQNITFPGTMIDRIVPATTTGDIQKLQDDYGYEDQAMVVAEPFTQWVIEDSFCAERPEWEKVGALIVNDVSAYETMKLRLLNGSHSLLAYIGYLSGYETIYQAMQDQQLVDLTRQFMASASETLSMPEGFSVEAYQEQLIERFANPGLQHRTWQIAMDGSQKVPQRWLNTLRDLIQGQGKNIDLFCLALAAWMRYSLGVDENKNTIELSDPISDQLKEIAEQNQGDFQGYILAFFKVESVFEQDLLANTLLIEKTSNYLQQIYGKGMKATVNRFLTEDQL